MKCLTTSVSSKSVKANFFFLEGVLQDGFSSDFEGDSLVGVVFVEVPTSSVMSPFTLADPLTNDSLRPFVDDSSFVLLDDSEISAKIQRN